MRALWGLAAIAIAILTETQCASDADRQEVFHVSPRQSLPDLYEASVVELYEGLERGDFSSVDLVKVSRLSD